MVLAEYCAPHFTSHVPKLTRGLRAKLDTLMEALDEAVRHPPRNFAIPKAASSCGEACRTMSIR